MSDYSRANVSDGIQAYLDFIKRDVNETERRKLEARIIAVIVRSGYDLAFYFSPNDVERSQFMIDQIWHGPPKTGPQ